MCGGGGSSAAQDAMMQEQDLASKRTAMKNQNDDLARMRAIARVNELYGVSSDVNGKEGWEKVIQEKKPVTTWSGGDNDTPTTNYITETKNTFGDNAIKESYDGSQELVQRNAGYGTVRQNALDVALNDLSKQRDVAGRDLKFNVARSGLTGGSVDVDKNGELATRYSDGVLSSNTNADGIVNNIRAKDESTRADLISRINAGMDATSATTSALAQMQNNQNQGRIDGQSNLLANFFNGIAGGVGAYQYAGGANTAQQQSSGNYYNPSSTKGKLS